MSFFPHVNPGDAFTPSAVLENNVRDCVNAYNLGGGSAVRGARGSALRIAVWNNTPETLPAGQAVALDAEDSPEGVIACSQFDADQRPWGVLESELPSGAVGDCVIGGIVSVPLIGSASPGDRLMPVLDSAAAYAAVPGGDAKVLAANNDQAVILLGHGAHCFGSFKAALMKIVLPQGEDDFTGESSGNGVFGLENGRLTLYPIGSCDGEEITPEEEETPQLPADEGTSGDGTQTVLALIDGANPNAPYCGEIRLGTSRIKVASRAFPNWKQGRDLCLVLQSDGKSVSVFLAPEMPDSGTLLARLICRNGAYAVVQEHIGIIAGGYYAK